MTDALQNLNQAIEKWRKGRATPTSEAPNRNPYGAKIYQLNMEWGEAKEAHARALDEKRTKYLEQIERLNELSGRWRAENPAPTQRTGRGRPKVEHPAEIKLWAATALHDGASRSIVRAMLGIANTERFNQLLAEGEELRKGQDW